MSTPPSAPRLAERLVALTDARRGVARQHPRRPCGGVPGDARPVGAGTAHAAGIGARRSRSAAARCGRRSAAGRSDGVDAQPIADDRHSRRLARGPRARRARTPSRSLCAAARRSALVVVTTLALALAANSTIFAVLDALVLRPYRFPGVDRMVMAASSDPQQGLFDRESVAAGRFPRLARERAPVCRTCRPPSGGMRTCRASMSPSRSPDSGSAPTSSRPSTIQPIVGRGFLADEGTPGQHRRVVLGARAVDAALRRRSRRSSAARSAFDGEPYEVVGVAPAGFTIPLGAQVWAPLAYPDQTWADRRGSYLTVVRPARRRADDRGRPRRDWRRRRASAPRVSGHQRAGGRSRSSTS